ncbi:hypothetical protein Tco_0796632 [Tanacetum coccineum]
MGFFSTLDAKARRQVISEVGYAIRDTWVDPAEAVSKIAPVTVREVNTRVTELAGSNDHDTQRSLNMLRIRGCLDSRARISQRDTKDLSRYIPLEDEHVFPTEVQPLPPVDSPTVESPGYVTESDPEEDPEEYEDDETEDGLVDYPMDGGDDVDDGDNDSSGDAADDEDEDEEDGEDEEEEEHPSSADFAVVASISLPPEAEVERLLAMTTPLPSPPISLSLPSTGERLARCMAPPTHSSPPPMPSPLLPSSGCPTQTQTVMIASTQVLIDVITAALPSPPLPPLLPSLYIPPPIDRRDDLPEFEQPPRKRLCLSTLGSRYEIGESSTAKPTRRQGIDYGDTWVDPAKAVPEIAPVTLREVSARVAELAELQEHDTQDLYALLEDAQDSRSRISQ